MCSFKGYRAACGALLLLLLLSGCATVQSAHHYTRTDSTAFAHPEQTAFGARFANQVRAHPGASGFHILTAGVDGLLARVQMIDAAQRSLDLQYFIFRGDTTGHLILDALTRASARGVAIRLLVDDGDTQEGDEQVLALHTLPNVQVRVFNPFRYRGHISLLRAVEFVATHGRLDYRMHNKLLVADDSLALIGGRNIGNEYFQIDPNFQVADDDTFVTGPLVQALSQSFDEYWNSIMAVPAEALNQHAHVHFPHHRAHTQVDGVDYTARIASGEPFAGLLDGRLPLVWANAQVLYDTPDKRSTEAGESGRIMAKDVIASAARVQHEFLMINPYVVPTHAESAMLADLRRRQARVGIVTNSLQATHDILAFAGYTRSRPELLREGVELYEIRARLGTTRGSGQTARISRFGNYGLHAKLMVFDQQSIFIGSMNFDPRSRHLNTEIGLIIESAQLAQETAARFAGMSQLDNAFQPALVDGHLQWRTQENGTPTVYQTEPSPSVWKRLLTAVLALLPVRQEL